MKKELCVLKNTKQTNKQDGAFMDKCVIAIFVIVPVYAFSHLFLSFVAGTEIAPVTSGGFFAFFAGEAGILAYIKRRKRKKKEEEEEEGSIDNAGEFDDVDSCDDHSISD